MKGIDPFSVIFKNSIKDSKSWCPFTHGEKINLDCYKSNPAVMALLAWTDKYIFCCKFLDADRYTIDEMNFIITKLKSPESLVYYEEFQTLTKRLRELISFLEKDISNKLGRISCKECTRLDEALVCFQNYCFYASIVMAVSTVESRIHELIKKTDKNIYSSRFEKFTLGQIIQVFDENQYTGKEFKAIKELMPNKHKPLIALLNQYRVFSAHPKEETITAQIAESVLHLAFNFMMDVSVCPYTKKELSCH
jgi:hypothetical protein